MGYEAVGGEVFGAVRNLTTPDYNLVSNTAEE
jgi:hypothetical protein